MTETNEDPLDAAKEEPVVKPGEDHPVMETRKSSVAKTRKASGADTRKALVAETREDYPVTETSGGHPVVEDRPVAMHLENLQKFGKDGVEGAASAASSFSESLQMFAAETNDYSKKSLENGSAFLEKLRRAKSLEGVIQIQTDYAKSVCAEFVAYFVKMSDLYCNLFKRDSILIEKGAAKIEGAKI
ncbi:MAG TPA: phasin family protein [Methylocella sp.]|jgi:hypothetical protein